MSLIDQILERKGLQGKKLTTVETETLNQMVADLKKSQITLDNWKNRINTMKDAVEKELIVTPEFVYVFIFKIANRQQIFLKARLANLLLLSAFLDRPQKAEREMERQVASIVSNK